MIRNSNQSCQQSYEYTDKIKTSIYQLPAISSYPLNHLISQTYLCPLYRCSVQQLRDSLVSNEELKLVQTKKGRHKHLSCNGLLYVDLLITGLTSLPQNQHPEHYRLVCHYFVRHLTDLRSYPDRPVHHLVHRSEHTFRHLQPGMQYSVQP